MSSQSRAVSVLHFLRRDAREGATDCQANTLSGHRILAGEPLRYHYHCLNTPTDHHLIRLLLPLPGLQVTRPLRGSLTTSEIVSMCGGDLHIDQAVTTRDGGASSTVRQQRTSGTILIRSRQRSQWQQHGQLRKPQIRVHGPTMITSMLLAPSVTSVTVRAITDSLNSHYPLWYTE
jgi:hypothetical protein